MKVLGKDKLQLTGHDWNIKILCPSSYDGGGGKEEEGEEDKRVMLKGLTSPIHIFLFPSPTPQKDFVFQRSEQNSLYLFYMCVYIY